MGAWLSVPSTNYKVEQSLDHLKAGGKVHDVFSRNNYDVHSHAQPSHDSRSMACQSECLSEHYIKAKKFAAFRT